MEARRAKNPRTGGSRISLQLTFGGLESMEAFKTPLEHLKHFFAPTGDQPLKPVDLLSKLFDLAESSLLLSV